MNNKRTIIIIILLILIGGEFSLMASPQKQVLEFSTAGFFNSPQLRTVYNFLKVKLMEQNVWILMIKIGKWFICQTV